MPTQVGQDFVANLPKRLPGLLFVAAIGVVGLGLEAVQRTFLTVPIFEALVASILVGVLVRNVFQVPEMVDAGANYAAKQVLEFAIVLLGITIDFKRVLAAGPALLGTIALAVVGCIVVSYAAGRALGLHSKLAVLIAVGNSICGNSAIAAVAPVIKAEKKDIASAIALTAVIGVSVVLTLPLLIPILGLSFYQYGVLAGLTVYAVPQVLAASFPVSVISGEVATLVKLTRVMFLGPVVLVAGLLSGQSEGGAKPKRTSFLPWFVLGFIALATVRTLDVVPAEVATAAQDTSKYLTILAMAGLGLGVELAAVRRVGLKVAGAVVTSLIFLVTFSIGLIFLLGING
ncbi:MAG: putative sulfate exporter family transporter [Chloroflexi bacterium]|nr:putative sulfate exporter family transporter [Chloroflexota bacterium]